MKKSIPDFYFKTLTSRKQPLWNPKNKTDLVIGWLLGSEEQEYFSGYYDKHKVRPGKESLYRIHQEISQHKDEVKRKVTEYLEEKTSM